MAETLQEMQKRKRKNPKSWTKADQKKLLQRQIDRRKSKPTAPKPLNLYQRQLDKMKRLKTEAAAKKIKAQDKKIAGDPQSIQSFPNKKSTAKFTLKQLGDTAMMVPELIKAIATQKAPTKTQMSKMLKRKKDFEENIKYYETKKYGGKITYKMSGGQVVSHGYDK